MAEREGFEPPVPCGTPDFESGTFDHSATSPLENGLYLLYAEKWQFNTGKYLSRSNSLNLHACPKANYDFG